ncbi:MAG: gluconokinase, GntK/IdnK-type [Nitrospira sp.]|nr:gluconokinase, GntK/IdnK-type [Nitrospira sp.]
MPQVVLIMGVSGAGKTTVGRLLADKLGWTFHDADEFHPSTNIEKMKRGVPLTDEDRRPWLQQLRQLIGGWIEGQRPVVLACSALTRLYREVLLEGVADRVRLVYLKGNIDLLTRRLAVREGHFMHRDLVAVSSIFLRSRTGRWSSMSRKAPTGSWIRSVRNWVTRRRKAGREWPAASGTLLLAVVGHNN